MLRTDLIRPIPDLLQTHANERGNKVAFRDARRSVTYAELFARTGRLAGYLADQGVKPGERVAMLLPNSVEGAESYLAITRTAAVGVYLNPQDGRADIAFKLSDCGARVVVIHAEHLPLLDELAPEIGGLDQVVVVGDQKVSTALSTIPYETVATSEPVRPARDDLGLDDPAWMLYTSGTTGRPKGVVLTQRGNLWVAAASWVPGVGYSGQDYVLSPLPLFHSYALNLSVVTVIAVGASEYLMRRFSTSEVLRLLRSEPFTFMPGVPTMFHFLLEAAREEGLGAQNLRVCVSAGAIMPASLNEAFEEAFDIPLLDGYGITETSTMVTMNWREGTRIMGSCGLPLPGSTVRLVDPETGTDVAPGEEGEVWVRGPHVMLGYHDRPVETAEAMEGGWYHTGDLARADQHGYLTITGRIKELIIRGGENIAPAEVETIVVEHESVLDAAVAGISDEVYGEVPVAFVVPRDRDGFDQEALTAFCAERLARYKVPARIQFVDAIPRTGSGKVQRYKLQEEAAATDESRA